jgi:hypothetical protein
MPTFSYKFAIKSPISLSPFAEIVATLEIAYFPLTSVEAALSSPMINYTA